MAECGTGESLITTVVEDVPVEANGKYFFSCRVRLSNLVQGKMYHKVMVDAYLKSKTTRNAGSRRTIAQMPYITPDDDWVDIDGDLQVDGNTTTMTIQVSCEADVKYEVDEPSLSQIVVNKQWKEQANKRIEKIRKGDITINVDISDEFDPSKVTIKVEQQSQSFPWGSAVKAATLYSSDAKDKAYRDFFLKNFKWATLENCFKWRFMSPMEGMTNFNSVDKALDVLIPNGIKVRGHCISWGKSTKIPAWLQKGNKKKVEEAVTHRIEELAERYQGVFVHYDVCNEQLHGDWYEQQTKNPHFIDKMFQQMNEMDESAELCLNDYDVCSKGTFTAAYRRQAQAMVERGVPLSYMGIQCHMSVYPDVDILTKRLQILSEAGVPLFITELDVRQNDVSKRAQGYEDIIRLLFSHPNIHGIVIWGFWKEIMTYETAALAEGKKKIKWNDAGQKVNNLWTKEWHTFEKLKPEIHEDTFEFRGFYGDYKLDLSYDGEIQWTHNFTLEEGKDVSIDVSI